MKIKERDISFNIFKYTRRDKIHFFINILLGVAIALFFHYAEKKEYGGGILDAYFDTLVSVESTLLQKIRDEDSLLRLFFNPDAIAELNGSNYAFIEIDRLALEEWGGLSQPLVPRDKLAGLVERVAEKKPKLVIIDILFDMKSCSKVEDRRFVAVVENAIKKYGTKFLFVATVDPVTGRVMLPFFFKEVKAKYPEHIFVSIPYFFASEYDNVVRFLEFYKEVSDATSGKDILWNTSLMAYAIVTNQVKTLDMAKEKILSSEKNGDEHLYIKVGKKAINVSNEDIVSSRLRFPFPVVFVDREKGILTLRNLVTYANNLEDRNLRDKVVFIGITDPIKNDIFKTPIGYMPGMYLIANGLFTVSSLQIQHEWVMLKFLIEFVVILLTAFLFLWLDSVPATIFSLLLILLLVPMSLFLFFRYNIFVNVVFPIVGIMLHKDITEFEEFLVNGMWKNKNG